MKKDFFVVIHYDEIALKGGNRRLFERKLQDNICFALGELEVSFTRKHDKFILEINDEKNIPKARNILKSIPGISYFVFAKKTSFDLSEMKEMALRMTEKGDFSTFRVSTKRSNKKFPLGSQELNEKIGFFLVEKTQKKVSLENPELTIFIEIGEKEVFFYAKKEKGVGGLPAGSSGKIISAISGGIDSPVASFMGMKRGLEVVFVHIFNKTLNEKKALDKIEKIVEKLSKFQTKAKLYIVPFSEIQKSIISFVPADSRMIVYRRCMFRIMNKIAGKEKAKGILTGDSLGQVASQTLSNLSCIYASSKLPIFPPLFGMNKGEIIEIAKQIGTFEISILPYVDCCSFMIAKHPQTKALDSKIELLEAYIVEMEKMIENCVEDSEVRMFGD